jgi:hypothetical protein
MEIRPFEKLALTKVGMQLFAFESYDWVGSTTHFGFSVFGTLQLGAPRTEEPLFLDCEITVVEGTASLYASLSGSIWKDALGIEGLSLVNLTLTADIPFSSPHPFEFEISAGLQLKSTTLVLAGSYSSEDIALSVTVHDVEWDFVEEICLLVSGKKPNRPDFPFYLGNAKVTISSSRGLEIEIEDLVIDDFTLDYGLLSVGGDHFTIKGNISHSVEFHHFKLIEAGLDLRLSSKEKETSFLLALGGVVEYEDERFTASVSLARGVAVKGAKPSWEWALYGAVEGNASLSIGRIFPDLKDSVVDVTISDVALLIGSERPPPLINQHSLPYKVIHGRCITSSTQSHGDLFYVGIQFCARIEPSRALDGLNYLAPGSALQLAAAYSFENSSFSLDVAVEGLKSIELAPGLVAERAVLRLQPTALRLLGAVRVKTSSRDLICGLEASISTNAIAGRCFMEGEWHNPLDVGEHIFLADLTIALALPLPAATAPVVYFAGKLVVGSFSGSAKVQISNDPSSAFSMFVWSTSGGDLPLDEM